MPPVLDDAREALHRSLLGVTNHPNPGPPVPPPSIVLIQRAAGAAKFGGWSIPSVADGDNQKSIQFANGMIQEMVARGIPLPPFAGLKPNGQTLGARFEEAIETFLNNALAGVSHLRPRQFHVARNLPIDRFDQYVHLDEIARVALGSRELRISLGADYIIRPDIVVYQDALSDLQLNGGVAPLIGVEHGRNSSLLQGALPTLHASISCKVTIRSDRVQNTRVEALNLVRNRKGKVPRIIAVTAEPLPSRLRAITIGTGDMDCCYHIALPELVAGIRGVDPAEVVGVEELIEGKRLRDISDLPLDLLT